MIFSLFRKLPFFRKNPINENARTLYAAIIEQSRQPAFYLELGADDDVDGRFEILTLHLYLVLRRFKGAGADGFTQVLFDTFMQNLDDSLREMGVGDMSIGRKIRGLAEAFYGRIGAYEQALDGEGAAALTQALSRNVYESENAPEAGALADYVKRAADALAPQTIEELLAGRVTFPEVIAPQATTPTDADAAVE